MKKKVTLLNMISGLILQVCTIVSGFILPKIILSVFGSEVNGLVSSLTQFLQYIALTEGGVTNVVMASLYKPIVEHDTKKLSAVLTTADAFFKKIGIVFILYALGVSVVYPLVFRTGFSFAYVACLTIILAMNLFIRYMFSLTLKTLLTADKKEFIVSLSQAVIVVLNLLLAYVSVRIYPSIHLLKFISGLLFIIQPVLYSRYVRKHYSINWHEERDTALIKNRWNGFAVNLAAFIHSSTDVTVLTIFTDLRTVSVYSVYTLISVNLKKLINSCLSGISSTVGHAYARKNWQELHEKMDVYEYLVFLMVFLVFTVACLLITPFVQIYTKGISDADYFRPTFGILILAAEAIYLLKVPHVSLAYNANKFREITIPSFIEAGLNIGISVLLVPRYGLSGVAIGTVIAMTYRTMFHVYFTSTFIPDRPQRIFYRKFFLFLGCSLLSYFLCAFFFPMTTVSLLSWCLHGVLYTMIVGGILAGLSVAFFQKELRFFIQYLRRKK